MFLLRSLAVLRISRAGKTRSWIRESPSSIAFIQLHVENLNILFQFDPEVPNNAMSESCAQDILIIVAF